MRALTVITVGALLGGVLMVGIVLATWPPLFTDGTPTGLHGFLADADAVMSPATAGQRLTLVSVGGGLFGFGALAGLLTLHAAAVRR